MTQSKEKYKRKYTQYDYEYMYVFMLTGDLLEESTYLDCKRIISVIKTNRDILMSVPASYKFWKIRSDWHEANWLDIGKGEAGDQHILESWDKLIEDWYADDN